MNSFIPVCHLEKNYIFLTSPNFSARFFRAILLGLARPDFSGWNSGQPDSPLARGPAIFIGPKARGLENVRPDPTLRIFLDFYEIYKCLHMCQMAYCFSYLVYSI